jgi:hypothetical protein
MFGAIRRLGSRSDTLQLQECLQELVTHHILASLTCPFSQKARQVETGQVICEGRLPSLFFFGCIARRELHGRDAVNAEVAQRIFKGGYPRILWSNVCTGALRVRARRAL